MDESDPDLLPEGLEDRLAHEALAGQRVMRAMLDAMDAHGYDRVVPPLIEFERSLAARMSGIRTRRMFRFVDPASLRTLALRSDITPQIGRIAETRLAQAPRPLRLCYAGQVVTIRGDGLDPARERLQVGAELIGRDSVEAAAEVAGLAIEALAAAGAKGIAIDFTLPDLVDTLAARTLPLPADRVEAVRAQLDAKDAGGALDGRIAGLRAIAERLSGTARITLDPTERHGFEYQSWFGFTLFAEGVRGNLGRGGTYRIAREHGEGEVATGFSLYPDTLSKGAAVVAERNSLFLPLGHDPEAAARLRAIGWRTVAALDDRDRAGASGCTHVLKGAEPHPLGSQDASSR